MYKFVNGKEFTISKLVSKYSKSLNLTHFEVYNNYSLFYINMYLYMDETVVYHLKYYTLIHNLILNSSYLIYKSNLNSMLYEFYKQIIKPMSNYLRVSLEVRSQSHSIFTDNICKYDVKIKKYYNIIEFTKTKYENEFCLYKKC